MNYFSLKLNQFIFYTCGRKTNYFCRISSLFPSKFKYILSLSIICRRIRTVKIVNFVQIVVYFQFRILIINGNIINNYYHLFERLA